VRTRWRTWIDRIEEAGGPDFGNGWTFAVAAAFLALGLIAGLLLSPSAHGAVVKPPVPVVSSEYLPFSAADIQTFEVSTYLDALHQQALAERRAAWERLHRCEQGNDWYAAGSTRDGYFEGGLGIAASLYKSIAGHSALQDSPDQQIAVAEIALGQVGRGAWACPAP